MPTPTEPDHHAISAVVVRYANTIDRRDWRAFRTCFTDDCLLDYGRLGSWRGGDTVTAYMEEVHLPYGRTLHRITNVESTVGGDTAEARSYVDALLYRPDGSLAVQVRGTYDDRLLRTDGRWRIESRRFTAVEHIGGTPSLDSAARDDSTGRTHS
ncbi:nuclear transport factor 2 family protein [Pseudonocardia oroxyli]|uniref:3-phenylpropionate/cinnamic acid dioxygenase, small subunit n=1 Tax=Pseudonocardia oroxyli TaxID=366584 RepID=A0A1G7TIP0_PSEOR|nr:nuclear transport factor 2 family protein [Pseudonocardia oroxyli]SDG35203.1 3-phenylpropionate/cinnamic acid dioxygenase, small subunit [Pseudonocardia oroxyli]